MRSLLGKSTAFSFIAASLLLFCGVSSASADAKGSMARVDQEIRILIGADDIKIEYDTALNRPAAFLEVVRMDVDQDGRMSKAEQARYFSSLGDTLADGLELSVNGLRTSLKPIEQVKLTMPFTKTYRFVIPHPDKWTSGAEIELHNDNYLSLPGTVTIVLDPGDSADITHQHIVGEAIGDSGRSDLSDPQQRDIAFRYRKGTGKQAPNPKPQAVSKHENDPPPTNYHGVWIVILSGLGTLVAVVFIGPKKHPIIATLTLLVAGVALYAANISTPIAVPDDARAIGIFRDLHQGIYRAFNERTEDEIYDALAKSLEGDLLDKVYNEVHQTIAKRKNKRMTFRIRRVKAISTEITPAAGAAFKVRHHWRVYGTVTHMAHSHPRFNEYRAVYTVRHNGKAWRIADSQIQRHKRVSVGQS
ncbi:MAG: hypothetical protein QGG42_07725 [Phycisphaerae bacterium]|nr:hypothetical protein [Phycisphaerae bacterium]